MLFIVCMFRLVSLLSSETDFYFFNSDSNLLQSKMYEKPVTPVFKMSSIIDSSPEHEKYNSIYF